MRTFEQPVTVPDPHERSEKSTITTHPAFAQITAHRFQSGKSVLYGSDFVHDSGIEIRIASSEVKRSLSRDWYHMATQSYVSVILSEAQWATFVSTLNHGSGTPCTLETLNGEVIPGIPEAPQRKEQFQNELGKTLKTAQDFLSQLGKEIDAAAVSLKVRNGLKSTLHMAQMNLEANLKFVADQFNTHIETQIEHAKVEIEAHMQGAIQCAGLQALGGKLPFQLRSADSEVCCDMNNPCEFHDE